MRIGLYWAFVPMVAYALLGSARPLSVSTTFTVSLLTATAIAHTRRRSLVVASTLAAVTGGLLAL